MKTDILKQIEETAKAVDIEAQQKELQDAVNVLTQLQPQYKQLAKTVDECKTTVKALCAKLGLKEVIADNGGKVTITEIDKSYLDPLTTMDWLKKNGYERFIKTKEYFDEAELAMAIVNNELPAQALAPFTVDKKEVRVNIKI